MDRLLSEEERNTVKKEWLSRDICNSLYLCRGHYESLSTELLKAQDAKASKWWIEKIDNIIRSGCYDKTRCGKNPDCVGCYLKQWQQLKKEV